ncbi:MAG: flagellar basal-body MS-ring/collar protein FliF [Aliidongia sp.]
MGAFLQTIQKLGPVRLAALGGTAVLLIGFFIFLMTRLTSTSYGLLYADLDLKDSAQIASKLDAMNVPYQVVGDGSTIRVPVDQVARLRLTMAETGIPHGGSIGYEIFDKNDALGTTSFQQGVNEMRALEGELEKSVSAINLVEQARVHLVLPKRELFSRDKQEPSASIILKLRGAAPLSKQQIAAIQNLVASAVPGLKTTRISIVDQAGNLLARGNGDPNDGYTASSNADEQRVAYEQRVGRSVEEMLERSLGPGHARVDVNSDMDFDKLTVTSESFDPDGQVVRSTQTVNDEHENAANGDAPITVQTNLPDGASVQGNGATPGKDHAKRVEETTNYEISRKTTSQTRETGLVKRMSVAVLIDGTYATNQAGERSYQPRSTEELDQLKKLVQSAIGFDEKRGDQVEVVNMRFAQPEEALGEPPPILFGMNKQDLFRATETLVLAVVAILIILLVVRPLVTRMLETTREAALASQRMLEEQAAMGMAALPAPMGMGALTGPSGTAMALMDDQSESMIDISQVEGRVRASSMKKIGEIVDKHPEEAVAIIRSWMYQSP